MVTQELKQNGRTIGRKSQKCSNASTISHPLDKSTQASKVVPKEWSWREEPSDTSLAPNSGVNRRQSEEIDYDEHQRYSESQPTQILALHQIRLLYAIPAHDHQTKSHRSPAQDKQITRTQRTTQNIRTDHVTPQNP
ncbi:hypothetical protein F511_42448 [Dorcoceras hygrometricum]|uniref:Uncharacterized protein n=1 Tax=Dorcoceras hygrometricum TaxID=472368 RepID=A0A2Z7AES4_9LAMI|nr:hypothetical protein F511_42448 [Dorcoceras hygrometricum]